MDRDGGMRRSGLWRGTCGCDTPGRGTAGSGMAARREAGDAGFADGLCSQFRGCSVCGMPSRDLRALRGDADGAGERRGNGRADGGEFYACGFGGALQNF